MHPTSFILAGIRLLTLSSPTATTASALFNYDFNHPNLFKYPPKYFKCSGNSAYKNPDPEEGKKDPVERRGTATEKFTSILSDSAKPFGNFKYGKIFKYLKYPKPKLDEATA
ncbi:hypothetical protein BDD12DRAFT_880573 [Trichophaea hybrida]|nr:hypothetical protein BDD12DRAFT_880573 [Trichophaea hybrida]